jgi:signal transduction histidine kinase/ligand-binding sensor domain-containing protein
MDRLLSKLTVAVPLESREDLRNVAQKSKAWLCDVQSPNLMILSSRRCWCLRIVVHLALGACLNVHPAAAQYRIDQWTTDHGLPQNSVLALLQTRDGYLWAATPDGLVRFDGIKFSIYSKATTPGLTTNRFSALLESADGDLWIGTEDRGVVRYRHGAFETFGVDSGLPAHLVWSIRARSDGRVIVFTSSGAAVFENGGFRRAGIQQPHPFIARRAPGTMLEPAGLVRFDGDKVVRQAYPPRVVMQAVHGVLEDNRGNVWLVTHDGAYFRLTDGRWTEVLAGRRAMLDPRTIHTDALGRVWMPTAAGLLVYEADGRIEDVDLPPDTSGGGFFAMMEDREGGLWLGSVRDGLFRLRRRIVEVVGHEEGLANDNVYPLIEDAAGRIWIGTWGGGLQRVSSADGKRWDVREVLPDRYVTALFPDRDGSVVAGLLHGGIVIVGTDDRVRGQVAAGLPDRVVSAILRDRAGTLWLGTNGGLVALAGTAVQRVITEADGLPDDRIRALTIDRGGRLWVGTMSGVALVAGGVVTSPPGSDALAGDHVRAIHEDDEGTLWIGTADAGLVRLRDGRATRYTTATGLASNGVFAILDDGAGAFWTSSNLGLARVARRELTDVAEGRVPLVTARSFTRADGLRTLEANGGRQPAAFRARDGRLWFATARGVAIVDPSRIPPASAPLAPVIERVTVEGRAALRPSSLEVEPGQAYISLDYGVGALSSPETVRFRVRLVGLDEAWRDVGAQRSMMYSRLRHGTYRFEVAAVRAGRVGPLTALPIRVLPRFHETWTFVFMTIVASSGVVLLVAQQRRARRQGRQRQEREFARRLLESQDRERERLAAEVHDGLGQHLLVIRNQALLGEEAPAGARDCLEAIADTAAQALDEVRTISAALHPATLERLGLVRAVSAMIRVLSQSTSVSIAFEAPESCRLPAALELQLYRIVQESLSNALRHAEATTITVKVEFGDHHVAIAVEDNGHGFDPARLAQRGEGALGLSSIRERARSITADLSVDSAPGRGTTIRLRVPLPASNVSADQERP